MRRDRARRSVSWGHLAFLAFVTAVVVAYLLDARSTSLSTNNILLVQPAAIIALVLVALALPQCFDRGDEAGGGSGEGGATSDPAAETDPVVEAAEPADERLDLLKVGGLMALFGIYCTFLQQIGFDVATFLFVAIGLVICGERRLWLVAAFSAVFTVAVVYGYGALVPYPFPMRIL